MPRKRPQLLVALAMILGLAGAFALSQAGLTASRDATSEKPAGPVGGQVLVAPLPTVAPAAGRAAVRAVRSYAPFLARMRGVRYRIVGVYPYGPFDLRDKIGGGPCASSGCIKVEAYDYTNDLVVDVLVDIPAVRPFSLREERGQPTLSAEEMRAAHAIADANPGVLAIVGSRHEHFRHPHPVSRETGPCAAHRCGVVFYELPEERYVVVLVDLSTERVVDRAGW